MLENPIIQYDDSGNEISVDSGASPLSTGNASMSGASNVECPVYQGCQQYVDVSRNTQITPWLKNHMVAESIRAIIETQKNVTEARERANNEAMLQALKHQHSIAETRTKHELKMEENETKHRQKLAEAEQKARADVTKQYDQEDFTLTVFEDANGKIMALTFFKASGQKRLKTVIECEITRVFKYVCRGQTFDPIYELQFQRQTGKRAFYLRRTSSHLITLLDEFGRFLQKILAKNTVRLWGRLS